MDGKKSKGIIFVLIGINRDTDDNKPDEYHDSVEEDYHSLIDDDYMEMWQRIRKENGDSII